VRPASGRNSPALTRKVCQSQW